MIERLYEEGCLQNREISWLRFDDRVLNEAKDKSVPLMERLKFVSIYTSNLTEFFRVRVGSLYDLKKAKFDKVDNKSGLTAKGQLDAIYPVAKRGCKKRDTIYKDIRKSLIKENIYDLDVEDCTKAEIKYLQKYFKTRIQPVLTPHIVDVHHPFPNLLTGVTYICAVLKIKKHGVFGFVGVPPSLNDIIVLPDENSFRFVHMEDVIQYFVPSLFKDADMTEVLKMKISRSAYVDPEDEAFDDIHDYREKMMKVIKERRKMNITRIALSEKPSRELDKYLVKHLNITKQMVFIVNSPFNMKYAFGLGKLLTEQAQERLLFPSYEPQLSPALNYRHHLFSQIQKKDVLLEYPYESMAPFVNLVKEAANDPQVVFIKITIYRLASHARLVEYLCQAAENGKEVDVLIELKARFDEQNNIDYSEKLEEAGCTVFYGYEHYKVHSKICLISKNDHGTLSHVVCLATGNFNENTAKQYTDLAILTSEEEIIEDSIHFFQNMMIGNLEGKYKKLLVAPKDLKPAILKYISQETKKKEDGYIFVKINGMSDEEIMQALIRASQAGVHVEMIIRGISCLLPGIEGKTENLHIRSIVGRYLEHSRIYVFGKGDKEKMYISSADFMTRNTERRVEIATPVLDSEIRERIHAYIDLCLKDTVKARMMSSTGRYTKIPSEGEKINSQEEMMKLTQSAGEKKKRSSQKGTHKNVVFQTKVKK